MEANDKIYAIYDRITGYRKNALYDKDELIAELVCIRTIIIEENDNRLTNLFEFIERQIDIVATFPSSTRWSVDDVRSIVENIIMTWHRLRRKD